MRRVLVAFSWHNTSVGYCQGLNMMAALMILVLEEVRAYIVLAKYVPTHQHCMQEDAFWCLSAVVEKLLPKSYYNHTMMAAQADQRVLTGMSHTYTQIQNRISIFISCFRACGGTPSEALSASAAAHCGPHAHHIQLVGMQLLA